MRYILFFCLCNFTLLAQPEYDFQLWKSIELQKDFGKIFQINLFEQFRLINNANTFGQNLTEVTFAFEPVKDFGASIAYRYSIRPDRNVHRISLNASYANKIKDWRTTFGIRLRGQWDRSDRSTDLSQFTLRPRFFVRYEPKGKGWKKFAFSIFGELFFGLDAASLGFNEYRVGADVNFEISANASLACRYFMDNEARGSRPDYHHVLQLGVTVNIPHKSKKDKDDDKDGDKDKKNKTVLPNPHIN